MKPFLLGMFLACALWGQTSSTPLPESLNLSSHRLSGALHAEVHLPVSYGSSPQRRYPLCLLLHGGGNNAKDLRDLGLAALATRHNIIIVAPDAGSALFVDPPGDEQAPLESALLQELLPELERRYRTLGTPGSRLLAGVSLGGYAALHIGIRHPELFGFVLSLSGVVELGRWTALEESFLPGPMRHQIDRALGPPGSAARQRKDLFTLLEHLSPNSRSSLPFLCLACGTEDTFLAANRRLAVLLTRLGIPHAFPMTPGGHDGEFWRRQLGEVLQQWGSHYLPSGRPPQGN